jgi:hypothetical protein
VRPIAVKCPECGASLRVQPDAAVVDCSYCGVQSQIRRRSRVLQIPVQPPPRAADPRGLPVAIQRPRYGLVLAITMATVAGTVALPLLATRCTQRRVDDATRHLREPSWDGWGGVLRDLDGDGVMDLIGRADVIQPEHRQYLAAYDGATGKRLWLSETIGLRRDVLQAVLGVADDVAILADDRAAVSAYSVRDGSPRWKIRLHEKVEALCAGAPGQLIARTADKRLHPIALADGAVQPSTAGDGCDPLATDQVRANGPDRIIYKWHSHRDRILRDQVDGLSADESIHQPSTDVTIAIGHKRPGTRVPMIARYRSTERGLEVLWATTVPGVDPLSVDEGDPDTEGVAIGEGVVAVVYPTKRTHRFRLAVFATDDGRRRWDVELPGDSPLAGVLVSPTHVMVSRWDGLRAFHVDSGVEAYYIR